MIYDQGLKTINRSILALLILMISLLMGCEKDDCTDPSGNLHFQFEFHVDGEALKTDTLIYVNASGNKYLVSEIQFFISDVTLHKSGGESIIINDPKDIHYVDTDLPSTWEWLVDDAVSTGQYDVISFTFGINEQKNQSLMYSDPPESLMFWPENLGGGKVPTMIFSVPFRFIISRI